jgi:hypothetical protein
MRLAKTIILSHFKLLLQIIVDVDIQSYDTIPMRVLAEFFLKFCIQASLKCRNKKQKQEQSTKHHIFPQFWPFKIILQKWSSKTLFPVLTLYGHTDRRGTILNWITRVQLA